MPDTAVATEQPKRSVGRTIARNTIFGLGAQFALKVVTFIFQVLVVRRLGGAQYGQYQTVLAWASVFSVIGDLGITQYFTREIARNHTRASELFWDMVALRLILALLASIVTTVGAVAYGYAFEIVFAIFLFTLTYFLQAFLVPLNNVITGNERLDITSVFAVISQVIFIVSGGLFLFLGLDFIWLVIASALNIPVITYLSLRVVRRNNYGPPRFRIQPREWFRIIRAGLPFGFQQLTLSFAFRVDTIVLSRFVSDLQIGWYNVAYQNLTLTIVSAATAFNNALLPTLAREHERDPQAVRPWYYSSVKMILFLALPIAVGGMLTADKIIAIYQPEIAPAAVALAILIWDIPFVMYHAFCGILTTSVKLEHPAARIYTSLGIANLLLNLLLVPRFGIIGSSFATVFTDVLGAVQFYFLFRREFGAGLGFSRLIRLAMAAAVMGLVVYALRDLHIGILAAIGGGVYLALVWWSGAFSPEERTRLIGFANRLISAVARRLRLRPA
jgi:O-antigen/teichoic acid export membrane protein